MNCNFVGSWSFRLLFKALITNKNQKYMKQLTMLLTVLYLVTTGFMCSKTTNTKVMNDSTVAATANNAPYKFETVPNDPLGVKMYTLSNGLKIYLSVKKDEPRIFTNVAVHTGSRNDPSDCTGLAHYLEHMMFKGTSQIGAMSWAEESKLLKDISDLYEVHKTTTDPAKRKELYAQIDAKSGEAAKMVAANEYDKLVSSMGAKATNAYTWVDQTVYVNDIPSNELERWMRLESERFKMVVLRLFHTELEAVYEEYNINLDRDFRKVMKVSNEVLYPTHPYGTQTTIGRGQDLKSPSHEQIYAYFSKYYVPNNMAIVLSGDFDPNEVVALAEKYFGGYETKPVARPQFEAQIGPKEIVKREVIGQEAASVNIAWKLDGTNSVDNNMSSLVSSLLTNGQAGLIDLNIIQKQEALEARAGASMYEDYGSFSLYGKPKQGQTLEELEQLLIAQVNLLKTGNFPDWLISASITDMKLSDTRRAESNGARVSAMTGTFVTSQKWNDYVNRYAEMEKITKKDVMAYVSRMFNSNYVVVYKRSGEDKAVEKVVKPTITPITVNRTVQSEYAKSFMATTANRLTPQYADFKTGIKNEKLANGTTFSYIKNTSNDIFELNYIVEMGKNADKKLPIAIELLPYLGTAKYTAEQLQQEFFKLGLYFSVNAGDERCYITLSGLEQNFEKGLALFEEMLANVKPSQDALNNVVGDILNVRANDKKDKGKILRAAMINYARFGKYSGYRDILSERELTDLKAEELTEMLKNLTKYDHTVFYYGALPQANAINIIKKFHYGGALKPVAQNKQYKEVATDKKVLFVDFPMVQAEILMLSKGTDKFSAEEYIMAELYNNYFGAGLSSIVFQEIRESKALAYSASAFYTSPQKLDKPHYFQAYVGTQSDKMQDAINAMQNIIENMPVSESQIENARMSILKRIESERITKSSIYWTAKSNAERGFDYDMRKDVYEKMKTVTVGELKAFQEKFVKGRNYTILVLGSKAKINAEFLKTLGPITELSLEEVFGY